MKRWGQRTKKFAREAAHDLEIAQAQMAAIELASAGAAAPAEAKADVAPSAQLGPLSSGGEELDHFPADSNVVLHAVGVAVADAGPTLTRAIEQE